MQHRDIHIALQFRTRYEMSDQVQSPYVPHLNALWNEAAIHSYVQSIEQNTTPKEFVQIRLTDVDQRETRSSKQSFKKPSLTEQSLTNKNTMKAVETNVKSLKYVLFCCFR